MCNPESVEKFLRRSKIIQMIRQFLQNKDFVEVETPMLHVIPGGAAARPFVTHHNTYDMDLFLRISPELYLKKLVIGGMERVFEINRNFRNEGVSTRHNPEFTMLEFYMAYGDYNDGIALTESLFLSVLEGIGQNAEVTYGSHTLNFKAPFKRLTVQQSLIEIGALTIDEISEKSIDKTIARLEVEVANKQANYGEKLFALFEHSVEGKIVQPTFIVGYPTSISPLAKKDAKNPTLAARFELFVAGMELANGYTELNDPFYQADCFKAQVEARQAGDSEAHLYDADYVRALEYGLPPTAGVGIGIDRLVMLFTNTTSIKDVILFPTLKSKLETK
jgi:lysyl-tRNA synthetase class 2